MDLTIDCACIAIGTVLAAAMHLLRSHLRSNPGRVPFTLWFVAGRRGAFGCVLFAVVWFVSSLAIVRPAVAWMLERSLERRAASVVLTIALPYAFKGAKDLLQARLGSWVGAVTQSIDSLTTTYFRELISEVLGELATGLVRSELRVAIGAVYSDHLEELIRHGASRIAEPRERRRALGRALVQSDMQRIRYLLDLMGYELCLKELRFVVERAAATNSPIPDGSVDLRRFRARSYVDELLGGTSA